MIKYVFPFRLHDILSQPENEDIISWQPHGKAFKVHNSAEFTDVVLPSMSDKQIKDGAKFSSFLRNLNLYGFTRLYQGLDTGCYYHKSFVRGKRNLCTQMHRKKVNGNKVRMKPPTIEPNFYEDIEVVREQEEGRGRSTTSSTTACAGFSSSNSTNCCTNKCRKKKKDNISSSSCAGFSSKNATTNKGRKKKKNVSSLSLSTVIHEMSKMHQQDDIRDDLDCSYSRRKETISNTITTSKSSIFSQQEDLTSCMIEQREDLNSYMMKNDCDNIGKRETDNHEDNLTLRQHFTTKNDTSSIIPPNHETQQQHSSVNIFLSEETLKRDFEPDNVKSLLNALF